MKKLPSAAHAQKDPGILQGTLSLKKIKKKYEGTYSEKI